MEGPESNAHGQAYGEQADDAEEGLAACSGLTVADERPEQHRGGKGDDCGGRTSEGEGRYEALLDRRVAQRFERKQFPASRAPRHSR
jgi:hypothetical protein